MKPSAVRAEEPPNVLHVHRSERADRLVDGLAELLADRPADPFAVEVVAVPAKGVERWLSQRLSHSLGTRPGRGDGVAANVRFPHPSALVAEAVAASAGILVDEDPWRRGRLLWTLLEVIDDCFRQPAGATLAGHLGLGDRPGVDTAPAARRGRRLRTAQHLAGLFDSYAANRPSMLRDWAAGADSDGAGGRLGEDVRWQAELWRRVRGRIGADSPAERLVPVGTALRERPELVDLPTRVSILGPTRLTTAQLEVLAALGVRREVHLWLPHPCADLWNRVRAVSVPSGSIRRRNDPTAALPRNPLLASLGRDSRELALRLTNRNGDIVDSHSPVAHRPTTLLGRLQQTLCDDVPPGAGSWPPLSTADRSVQVHACHGPARQVEVLREVLLGLLADDPSLEPRDVLVMCPDIENYAALISATFGLDDDGYGDEPGDDDRAHAGAAGSRHPGHRLRVRLADRSLRQTNPLLGTLAALLELATARVTASEVLDLAALPPVRRRFRFRDDDLERLQEWVAAAGVRWGLDAAARKPFGLDGVPQNTWRAGLDRVLLGAAMAEDELRWLGLALPLDDVDSSDIDLAGRLAELVDRLAAVLDRMAGERLLVDWLDTLSMALDSLTAVRAEDSWHSAEARRELAQVATDAGARAGSIPLVLADVHALLADRLAGRPTRANFRTGNLTVCSMVPMRSVPHRVVCLLGLDDGTFPRSPEVDGDDILGRDPCVGERDGRAEDRQLLLDAVLAAQEHLVILYTGADPRTNAARPPAVPVGEILDVLAAVAVVPGGGGTVGRGTVGEGSGALPEHAVLEHAVPKHHAILEHIVVRHPLQPFHPRNFVAGKLGTDGPFSFDRPALRGAERALRPRDRPGRFLTAALSADDQTADIALDDLIAFLEHPVRAFLRQRLGVTSARDEPELANDLSVSLDGLQQWAIGDRLLRARLSGVGPEACRQAEWRRGALPPGELGSRVLDDVMLRVDALVAASVPLREATGRAVDVVVDLGARRFSGTVGPVFADVLVRVEYSTLAAKHRLRAWAQLLALSAACPRTSWTAVTIGRGRRNEVLRSTLGPVDEATARQRLAELVDLYARGRRAPLPMAVATSATYAGKRSTGMSRANAAVKAGQDWTGGRYSGERAEEVHRLVWGEAAELAVLLAEPSDPDERGPGWPADEPTRFGVLARRLWEPLLAAESLGPV